jgi:hypothetical protein
MNQNYPTEPEKPEPDLAKLINRLKCIHSASSERRVEFNDVLSKLKADLIQHPEPNPTGVRQENNCFINQANNLLDEVDVELYRLLQISKQFSEII